MDKKWLIDLGTGWLARLVAKALIAYGSWETAKAQDDAQAVASAVMTLVFVGIELAQSWYAHKRTKEKAVSAQG